MNKLILLMKKLIIFILIYSDEYANIINNKYINCFNKGSFFGLDSLFYPEKNIQYNYL